MFAAAFAARRAGSDAKALKRRWCHEVQIAIQRRRAAMARAVLPGASPHELWLLTGQGGRQLDPTGRAPGLDDGGPAGEVTVCCVEGCWSVFAGQRQEAVEEGEEYEEAAEEEE